MYAKSVSRDSLHCLDWFNVQNREVDLTQK